MTASFKPLLSLTVTMWRAVPGIVGAPLAGARGLRKRSPYMSDT